MRKLISACAVCAVAVSAVAVPSALGVKSAKQVGGTVSVSVTPTTVDATTTTVTATGGVASNSGCKKARTIHFAYVNGTTVGPEVGVTTTGSNGKYTVTLPKPTDTNPPTSSVVLRATVDQAIRKVGSKKKGKKTKKGRRFDCLQISGDSAPIAIAPAVP
ncbi:MAG TPA: hypothetical protein VLB79_09605 [Solirubrobacterales bacterium]|nr:hypothetical protein [Solirubrobacterales bacterium]